MPANNRPAHDRSPAHWFHILARPAQSDRLLHAARLTDKAWQQGDRVGIVCDDPSQAEELDELLWSLRPDAFIPHSVISGTGARCPDPVGILLCPPVAADWDTVIVLSARLPADAERFRRLALVANNDPVILNQARTHFRQLRSLGIEPRVHDFRKR